MSDIAGSYRSSTFNFEDIYILISIVPALIILPSAVIKGSLVFCFLDDNHSDWVDRISV
jgi:hypothetical protein